MDAVLIEQAKDIAFPVGFGGRSDQRFSYQWRR
jgi:hypothetical protein